MNEKEFSVPSVSIAGAPTIVFMFNTDDAGNGIVDAELDGAKLNASLFAHGNISLQMIDDDGTELASLTLHPREGRSATENVMDIGSALLWSHWRWKRAKATREAIASIPVEFSFAV